MGAKLYKQFQDFHGTIRLDKESSLLKEKRETLQKNKETLEWIEDNTKKIDFILDM